MSNEVFDLLARGLAQSLGAAEIGGVRLNEVGVELMLADQLTKAVANPRAIAVAVAARRTGRNLLSVTFCLHRAGD